ncbi:MAG: hypothetical protein IKU72_03645 [Oscillospiraceae bacterium]|nr:hypothetical protein [Oscillospiraceae bacterium]
MNGKRVFYCEIAYVVGIVVLAIATAFMEKADFGMSMVVAPAYLIYLKVSQFVPFFTFGMSEYIFQAVLLILLALVMHKVKRSYFLSFVTAFLYGVILDAAMGVVGLLPCDSIAWRIAFFVTGLVICAISIAFLFHTYFPPEAYELFVKELSEKFNMEISKTKTIYDCCSCVLGVVLSLVFFGTFVGVKFGTVICAAVNGWLIGRFSRLLESKFVFKDALPLREKMK